MCQFHAGSTEGTLAATVYVSLQGHASLGSGTPTMHEVLLRKLTAYPCGERYHALKFLGRFHKYFNYGVFLVSTLAEVEEIKKLYCRGYTAFDPRVAGKITLLLFRADNFFVGCCVVLGE